MDKVPYHRENTTSILGPLRLDGVVFRTTIQEILLQTLCPGDRVIANNVSIHQDQEARELIESVGDFRIFTPLFS